MLSSKAVIPPLVFVFLLSIRWKGFFYIVCSVIFRTFAGARDGSRNESRLGIKPDLGKYLVSDGSLPLCLYCYFL